MRLNVQGYGTDQVLGGAEATLEGDRWARQAKQVTAQPREEYLQPAEFN